MDLIKIIRSRIKAFKERELNLKTLKNSGWLISDKIITMIIGVFVTAVIARYFGPETFGQFNYALAFVSLFTAISTLGLDTLTVKSILDKKFEEGTILFTSLLMRVIGGTILTLFAALIIRFIEPENPNLHLLVLIMSFTMIIKSLEVIEYWIQAYQRAKISSIIRVSTYVFISSTKLLVVVFNGTVVHYTLIYTLDALIIGIALTLSYFHFRKDDSTWKFKFSYAKDILSKSWYLILSGLMVTLYMRIDQVMLGSMATTTDVGVYSAAVRIGEMWYFVPIAIITSFNPVLMNNKNHSEKVYIKSVQLLYTIILWLGISFSILILVFSKLIVGILYGNDYLEAANILSISIWAGTFATLGSATAIWLIIEGLQKYTLIYFSIGAAVNIILNYLLIPILGGTGAAIATLVSQVTVLLIVPTIFKETRLSTIMVLKALKFEGIKNK